MTNPHPQAAPRTCQNVGCRSAEREIVELGKTMKIEILDLSDRLSKNLFVWPYGESSFALVVSHNGSNISIPFLNPDCLPQVLIEAGSLFFGQKKD